MTVNGNFTNGLAFKGHTSVLKKYYTNSRDRSSTTTVTKHDMEEMLNSREKTNRKSYGGSYEPVRTLLEIPKGDVNLLSRIYNYDIREENPAKIAPIEIDGAARAAASVYVADPGEKVSDEIRKKHNFIAVPITKLDLSKADSIEEKRQFAQTNIEISQRELEAAQKRIEESSIRLTKAMEEVQNATEDHKQSQKELAEVKDRFEIRKRLLDVLQD